MPKLNRNQRKMIIEHAAQECANDLPDDAEIEFWREYDKVMVRHWVKLLTDLGQSYREPHPAGWYELVEFTRSADELDRDPAGHLYGLGEDDTEQNRQRWHDHYNDTIGLKIDEISYRAS